MLRWCREWCCSGAEVLQGCDGDWDGTGVDGWHRCCDFEREGWHRLCNWCLVFKVATPVTTPVSLLYYFFFMHLVVLCRWTSTWRNCLKSPELAAAGGAVCLQVKLNGRTCLVRRSESTILMLFGLFAGGGVAGLLPESTTFSSATVSYNYLSR